MHSACKSRPGISSSVLALVSQVYTIEQLKDFGFEFSSNQYSLSRKKASEENFTLVEYERHSPTSKTKVSDETKAKVSDILHEFSNSSSSTISLGTAGNGYQEIRYLTKPKRDIYYELKEKHPGIQLSLSKFYSLCPNNYRKPQKRTDVCNICAAGEKIKKKYDMAKGNENASLEQIMQLRIATEEFEVHKQLALEQRRNFKEQIARLSGKSLIIIADFKENFKIGGGPIETTRDFYQKSQISDLCFCVLSKSGDLVQRRYYNYLSENLSHDSLYVINCLKDLLCRSEFQEFEEVNLWSDSGPHFKNADYLYSACLELPQIFPSKKFKLNYFMENHGKSDVDGHFGVLSRWFKEIERNRYLLSIEDLVSAFREKAQVSENISDNNRVYNFQIYRKDAIRGLRIRAKVSSGFRNYLSFYLGDGGLMACPLSLPDPSKYFNIDFRIKVKRDIRTNKYAPDRSNPLGSDTDIMGSTSRNTQRIRVEMLRGIGVSLSI
ncbi:hypothetical protein BB558_007110 [Smittium angustum]|uniref:Uncharacterized protein n=1 Tax=Smittium angustum TaxID=133377 RepID=A0A2U1IVW8_SMIAN|nr:hypothetical protein BB558_007110 [Smittium angustum]